MIALFVYLSIALGFSFLCSIAEAVLLSVTTAYVSVLQQKDAAAAKRWWKLKRDIDSPLAAILSLNTVAHTVGAAGVGAQAANVFGSQYLGLVSAVLTLLILFFSEIIPKTLGSVYWRQLAPLVSFVLRYLIVCVYPLVWVSKFVTKKISSHPTLEGFSRAEFTAMAHLGEREGQLEQQEARILKNLFSLRETTVADVMTPNTVVFKLSENSLIADYFEMEEGSHFSRVPLYREQKDHLVSFVLRSDLLTAKAEGKNQESLKNYGRELIAVLDKTPLLATFELSVQKNAHLLQVVDEYGSLKGIVTLEDIIETLVGEEIVDEGDMDTDMQALARRRWLRRAKKMGIDIDKH